MQNTLLNKPSIEEIVLFTKESSPLKDCGLSSFMDKFIIHKIAKMLPANSVAVEIGTYLGASASLMAHANPQLEVHAYDLFDDHKYDPDQDNLIAKTLGSGLPRSLENVSKYLSDYSNIHLYKVDPLEEICFEKSVDMFIEDSSHQDPQLQESLDYWLPKVKVNGFILLHDYRPWLPVTHRLRHLDVEKHVDILNKDNSWRHVGNFGSFAIFQKVTQK